MPQAPPPARHGPRGDAGARPGDPRADELARLPPAERALRFRGLAEPDAAAAFDRLNVVQQRELVGRLDHADALKVLERMAPDDRARLLDGVPDELADRLVAGLSSAERDLTEILLAHPPESAGRIMSPEHVELQPQHTVAEALAAIRRRGADAETLLVIPVADHAGCLAGVVRLTDLVLATANERVGTLMDPAYPSVAVDDDQEPVARLIQEHDLLAVPVVDHAGRLAGIVTVDDAMEVIEHEESEDAARLAAVSGPLEIPYHAAPVRLLVRARVTWLLLLVAAATLTVTVLGAFESTLEDAVTLALFIPLLIGTGGNCGAQAATTMTRAIAVGDVRSSDLVKAVLKEARVGLLIGLLFALLGFPIVTAIWSVELAATVSITLLAICAWATSVGALLPLVSTRVGVDPAVVSAPLVTTFVDATGLLIYFGVAQLLVL